ncbi:MAG: hypothetical protein GTN62_03650 [Gemmatimonadales bacterium]|nr:hypothetical protein [Gemmatimonadales bacterium]NIN10402.1 hypothetical protein [Gemmatimonadales bacterium]NIN49194.1 hypothetical protein [Gemmatimonadales bacterium]NIP06658.1 hypothetical protein [Gemmatimonadales bacterium]NIQ99988.1 hypothetical protein [Gemmatimonadales bacterium]
MSDVPDTVTDPDMRARLSRIQQALADHLESVDPHHRLAGRPVSYHVIAGQTFEIVYRDVPSIDESEVLGVKRLIGEECFCRVSPQTAETLTVRFVVPLGGR